MTDDLDRRKQFTRRALMLGGGQLVLVGGLIARLYQLQIVDAAAYQVLSDENSINVRLLAPPRGLILDRFGVGLAVNRKTYRLVLISEQTDSVPNTLDRIGALIDLTDRDTRRVLKEVSLRRAFVPVTVREDLSWHDVTTVEVNAPTLPGVQIEQGQTRFYPEGAAAAHVTGYVGAVSEAELNGNPLFELPGFRTGKNGVERVFDKRLRGTAGRREVEVNSVGRVIREISRHPGDPGQNLTLAIDMGLQGYASRRLGDKSGSVVVMDLKTGDVLALVSSPSFNPNDFNNGISSKEWQALLNNPKAPLVDKAIAGQYPPGSTFKPMTALAGLAAGVVTPQEKIYCPGYMKLGNHIFHCWKTWGHGELDMAQAITQSCDVYFYHVAHRLGIDRIAAMARRFGLGAPTGIELDGEQPGLVPTKEWKQAVLGHPWLGGETLIAGIGQGYMLTTPLQLAVMVARIGSGGVAVAPRLARLPGAPVDPTFASVGIDPAHLAVVRKGMVGVVNDARTGTAYNARITEPGMAMAGKTGTAQVRRNTSDLHVKNEDLPWKERDHALFIAYAPIQAPRYACAVIVEHGGGGSTAAAPIARDVLVEAQRRRSARWPGEGGDAPAAPAV